MLYHIRLSISYDYARPAAGGRHLLRLLPLDLPGVQTVANAVLAISPRPAERSGFTDFFGNPSEEIALNSDHSEIVFTATARVDRSFAGPGPDTSPPLAALAAELYDCTALDGRSPHHFLHASPRITATAPMTAYARAATKAAPTTRTVVEKLGLALHRDMTFDSDATTVDTPPAEAFERRTGVCQDFAQVMIAALRGIGVPAGYVSGFLRTVPPPGKPRLEGADAMHAWVRAWCGKAAGWVEYDPTNACFVGADHIVVAYGRDYGDVAPVAGVLRISGRQTSKQAVDVIAL